MWELVKYFVSSGALASCLKGRNKLCDNRCTLPLMRTHFLFPPFLSAVVSIFHIAPVSHRCVPFSLRRHSLKGEFPFCYYLNRAERGKSINSLVWHLPTPESRSINRRLTLPLFTRITLTRRMNGKLETTTGSW